MEENTSDDRADDSNATEVNPAPSKAAIFKTLFGTKARLFANYVLDGFAPFSAVIAIVIAVMALNDNKVIQAELAKNVAVIEQLNANFLLSKAELDKLKIAMTQERAVHDEERKKLNDKMMQIIHGASKMQDKLKISPTLEQQMQPLVISPVTQLVTPISVVVPPANTVPAVKNKSGVRMDALKEKIDTLNKK